MFETGPLCDLQVRRRELENELAALSSKEIRLVGDLQNLEESIISQLQEKIKTKKTTLSNLEAQKCDLQNKLHELKSNEVNTQKTEEPCPELDVVTVGVVENTPIERVGETEKKHRFF